MNSYEILSELIKTNKIDFSILDSPLILLNEMDQNLMIDDLLSHQYIVESAKLNKYSTAYKVEISFQVYSITAKGKNYVAETESKKMKEAIKADQSNLALRYSKIAIVVSIFSVLAQIFVQIILNS